MDFEVGGHKYRSMKLDAFRQFHIARKLAPVIGAIAPALQAAEKGDGWSALLPLAQVISTLPEEDCNFVLQACLAATQRQVGNVGWQPVWNVSAKALQFEDIGLVEMIHIAVQVIQENLGNFTGALSPISSVAAQ